MGLDTSHDCWSGSYIRFMSWREELARAAGMPPLQAMTGFYSITEWAQRRNALPDGIRFLWPDEIWKFLPIAWEALRPDVLHELLNHSDCEGELRAEICAPLAERLIGLLPELAEWAVPLTKQFIQGLQKAAAAGEAVVFH